MSVSSSATVPGAAAMSPALVAAYAGLFNFLAASCHLLDPDAT